METLVEKVGGVQVLHLRGRLDLAISTDLQKLLHGLIKSGESKILLDCRELAYVSSSGLATFIAAGKSLAKGKLVFAGLSPHIRSLFQMTGIATLFEIYDTQDEAVQKLGGE